MVSERLREAFIQVIDSFWKGLANSMLLLTTLLLLHYLMTRSAQFVIGYPRMPQIQVSPQVRHQLGSTVTITCFNGYDRYTVQHCVPYKENVLLQQLSMSIRATWYTIESATSKDEGFYTCHCQDNSPFYQWREYPETSLSFRLVLHRYPEKPQIRVVPSAKTNIGSKVTIECSNFRYALKECWFYKYGEYDAVYSNVQNTRLGVQYIISSTTARDEGFYACECNTELGWSTEISNTVNLAIKQVPATINHATVKSTTVSKAAEASATINHATEKLTTISHATDKLTTISHATEAPATISHATVKSTTVSNAAEKSTSISHATDFSVMNIIRLCIGFAVLLLMFIFMVESRWQHSGGGVSEQYPSQEKTLPQ